MRSDLKPNFEKALVRIRNMCNSRSGFFWWVRGSGPVSLEGQDPVFS